jgi:hypothetical protein
MVVVFCEVVLLLLDLAQVRVKLRMDTLLVTLSSVEARLIHHVIEARCGIRTDTFSSSSIPRRVIKYLLNDLIKLHGVILRIIE